MTNNLTEREFLDAISMSAAKSVEPDMVNKPNHYQLSDGKDCFDVMIEMFGVEAVQTYCVLNAFTYLFRHARKNGTEDVLKAEYNLAKFKELEERRNG